MNVCGSNPFAKSLSDVFALRKGNSHSVSSMTTCYDISCRIPFRPSPEKHHQRFFRVSSVEQTLLAHPAFPDRPLSLCLQKERTCARLFNETVFPTFGSRISDEPWLTDTAAWTGRKTMHTAPSTLYHPKSSTLNSASPWKR